MKLVLSMLCSLAVIAIANSQDYGSGGPGRGGPGRGGPGGSSEPASYNFQYDVNDPESGNNFGHQESRDGSRADGKYYVQLPDSRLMTVEYYADETGYHPTITFDGEGSNDQFRGEPSNQYQQPPSQQYSQPSFGK